MIISQAWKIFVVGSITAVQKRLKDNHIGTFQIHVLVILGVLKVLDATWSDAGLRVESIA